jgi:hypothetical protein
MNSDQVVIYEGRFLIGLQTNTKRCSAFTVISPFKFGLQIINRV